jgi:alkanesulfonate monooxygenase SsuD/methylene tetrahydromethanopterin reductase-like flavin-dependent oxidoreductase (luciferase family)
MPKPLQAGGVPIWVSGRINANVVARVVRFGAGWIPWGDDAVDPRPGIERLRAALRAAGRADDLLVTATLPDDLADVPRLVEAGITDFRIARRAGDDELAELVAEFRQASSRA